MYNGVINKIKYIDRLIQIKGTGKPREFANKIGISERSLYEYIRLMKGLGAPIVYSRGRKSYYYTFDGEFKLGFESV